MRMELPQNVFSKEYDWGTNSFVIDNSLVILNMNCRDYTFCKTVNKNTVKYFAKEYFYMRNPQYKEKIELLLHRKIF